ncbi:ATP-binding protein [Halostagnicola sp. A-GB9-2]|uniref:PAS domain-containing sensor histidine kinase n=1 Tax=Halostagnicola sp. A-GB9-2 TaxID=3048066 RepID=UPI0024C04E5B|nr:ATP-binding protein [Halostagnicola sp. A-GB9-2]MDJ1431063.1 ATP-binding protein [Halostagnicola sp. A-GB9-2]
MNSWEPEALVTSAVDTLPMNFAILDEEGTILHTNRTWREFGEANDIELRPSTIGLNYLEVTAQSESETARAVVAGLSELLEGDREIFEFEYPCHSPDTKRWFLMRAASFAHGEREYVAVAHFDITERREYQQQLERSNERLEQFAHSVSHDLQEPLRMVSSYLQLLEQRYGDELDEDAEEFIKYAVDGADRMESMIEGLLTFSRIDAQGDTFEPVNLEEIIDEALANLEMRIEETAAEITVESLPTVRGDPNQLRLVFQNLLDNAIQYSGDGSPRITISSEREGEEWTLSVSDEGIGIDHEDEDRVFEMFQRLHSHEEYVGSGIGLTICRRILERHGGEIWIDSAPGDGTTISFTLPAVDDSVD